MRAWYCTPVFHLGNLPVHKPNVQDNNMDSYHQHSQQNAEHKKLDTKDHIRYNYTHTHTHINLKLFYIVRSLKSILLENEV